MRKTYAFVGGALCLLLLLLSNSIFAAVIIDEDFESYPIGGFQPAPDSGIDIIRNVSEEIAIAVDESGNQYLAMEKNDLNSGNEKPRFNWNLNLDADASLYLSVDLLLKSPNYLYFIFYDGSNKRGPYLTFSPGGSITAAGFDGNTSIGSYNNYRDVWYRFTFIIKNMMDRKYDLIVERLDGSEPLLFEEISFRDNDTTILSRLHFYNSGTTGTQYIDNILLIDNFETEATNIEFELTQGGNLIENFQEGALANNEIVEVKVYAANPLGEPVVGKTLSLSSSRGDDRIFAIDKGFGAGATDSDGYAYFQLQTIKSTTVQGREPVKLTLLDGASELAGIELNFRQVISLENSQIVKKTESEKIWADGEDIHTLEVQLKDYEGVDMEYPTEGPEVKLTKLSSEAEVDISGPVNADESGKANFTVKAATVGVVRIGAEVAGEPLLAESQLEFVAPVSSIEEVLKEVVLASGYEKLTGELLPAPGKVPADGLSFWNLSIKLVDSQGAAYREGKVALSTTDQTIAIEPASGSSDTNGEFSFTIAKADPALEAELDIVITVSIEDGKYQQNLQYKFVPDRWGPIALEKYPVLASGESCDVTDPVWIIFNEKIVLSDDTEIRLTPYYNNSPLPEYTVSNKNDNPLFAGVLKQIAISEHPQYPKEQVLHFQPTRKLRSNLTYKIELFSVKDQAGNDLELIDLEDWAIIAIDTSPPRLLSSTPHQHAREVSSSLTEITLTFDEEIDALDEGSYLLIDITKDQEQILGECTDPEYLFDEETGLSELKLQLPVALNNDTYYKLRLWGISDVVGSGEANYIPEDSPIEILFKTTDTRAPQEIATYPEAGARDIPYETLAAKIYFDEIIVDNGSIVAQVQRLNKTGEPVGAPLFGSITVENIGTNGVIGYLQIDFQNLLPDSRYQLMINGVFDEQNHEYSNSWEFITAPFILEPEDPYLEGENYVIRIPVSDSEEIMIYIPKQDYSPELSFEVENLATADKLQLLQTLPFGHFGSQFMYMFSMNQEKLSENISVTIPYTVEHNGTVQMVTTDGEEVFVETEQLYAAYYRTWVTASGKTEGEWVPLATERVQNQLSFKIQQPGIYAVFAAPAWMQKKLIEQVSLTANPFAPGSNGLRAETTFKFNLAQDSMLTLTIYDVQGRVVGTLLNDVLYPAGYHGLTWDGRINGRVLPTGLYVYRLIARTAGNSDNPDVGWVSGALGIKN